jgi:hypothetical protein
MLARASLKGTRQASSWTAANSRVAAQALQRNLSASAAWSSANAKAASRISLAAASAGYFWAADNAKGLSHRAGRIPRNFGHAASPPPTPDATHRALVVRRCTALVCVEARRARLPAIRAS